MVFSCGRSWERCPPCPEEKGLRDTAESVTMNSLTQPGLPVHPLVSMTFHSSLNGLLKTLRLNHFFESSFPYQCSDVREDIKFICFSLDHLSFVTEVWLETWRSRRKAFFSSSPSILSLKSVILSTSNKYYK